MGKNETQNYRFYTLNQFAACQFFLGLVILLPFQFLNLYDAVESSKIGFFI